MSPVLRTFDIRVERFAEGGSEVVTVAAVNRAGAWSRAAARVDDPNNIWRMEMLTDNGRRLRVGLHLPNGEPDFYGGVPVDEAVEQDHPPQVLADSGLPGAVRGIDQDATDYEFSFTMFTEVTANTYAHARSRTEAWSLAAFAEAVGQVSVLELTYVAQQSISAGIPYGGVTVDLSAGEMAFDLDTIAKMRQRAEEAERIQLERLRSQIPVAIVVGGSSRIGRLLAEDLAHQGIRIAIVGPQQTDLDRAAAEIVGATGVEVLPVAADVGNSEQVRAMAQRVRAHFGRINIVVHLEIRGIEDDTDPMGSNLQRTIELYGLPPHNTDFTAHWLDEWDDEWDDEKLRRLLYQDMGLTIFSADDALIMNYIRRP